MSGEVRTPQKFAATLSEGASLPSVAAAVREIQQYLLQQNNALLTNTVLAASDWRWAQVNAGGTSTWALQYRTPPQSWATIAYFTAAGALSTAGGGGGGSGTFDEVVVASGLVSSGSSGSRIPKSIFTAAGSLLTSTAAGTPSEIPAASAVSGDVLTFDGSAWAPAAPTSGGVDPIFGKRLIYGVVQKANVSTTVNVVGGDALAHSGVGVPTNSPQATHAGYYEAIGAGAGNTGIENGNGTSSWGRWDWRQKLSFFVRSPASIATKRVWLDLGNGMSGTAPLASGTAGSASRHIGLAYDSAVSPNWLIQSGDGTDRSGLDTGLVVVVDTDYRIVLDHSVAGTLSVSIYTGTAQTLAYSGAKTTNLPTGTGGAVFEWADTNLSGVAVNNGFVRVAFLYESDY